MKKEIYLIKALEVDIKTDFKSTARIDLIHRTENLDALFLKSSSIYPLLRDYCKENSTRAIDIINILSDDSLMVSYFIESYAKKNPEKRRMAYVGKANISELEELLSESFEIVKIELSDKP